MGDFNFESMLTDYQNKQGFVGMSEAKVYQRAAAGDVKAMEFIKSGGGYDNDGNWNMDSNDGGMSGMGMAATGISALADVGGVVVQGLNYNLAKEAQAENAKQNAAKYRASAVIANNQVGQYNDRMAGYKSTLGSAPGQDMNKIDENKLG